MNRVEHLLVCIMEECAELQQAASKALRFGLDGCRRDFMSQTNADDICKEYADLQAVLQMLEKEVPDQIDLLMFDSSIGARKTEVESYFVISRNCGTLDSTLKVN